MMEFCYCCAGVEIKLLIPDEWGLEDERFLAPFRVEAVSDPHVYEFSAVKSLDNPEGTFISTEPGFCVFTNGASSVRYIGSVQKGWKGAYMRAAHNGKYHDVQILQSSISNRLMSNMVLNVLALEHLVAQENGFVFHSSYIQWEGKGILFTAPSGTGKSTQADLWQHHRGAEIINGDRSVIRVVGNDVLVYGIPFAGSSTHCRNRTLPLAAIVYLEQAPQTAIRKVRGYEAFRRIWEGVSVNIWDKQDMEQISETVTTVLEKVPVFHLACTPDESAVTALEKMLRK